MACGPKAGDFEAIFPMATFVYLSNILTIILSCRNSDTLVTTHFNYTDKNGLLQ